VVEAHSVQNGCSRVLHTAACTHVILSTCGNLFQVTNEIVRQLLEQNGFYSTEKPIGDMKFIIDCNYIGAMNTPGGGKNDIPNRLKRQFNLYYVPLPSKASINSVYGALVEGRFTTDQFDADTVDLSKRLVPMTIALWNKVQVLLLHYLVPLRHRCSDSLLYSSRTRSFMPCCMAPDNH
jgi:hypothetical protein